MNKKRIDFIIAGEQKAGTSALYNLLQSAGVAVPLTKAERGKYCSNMDYEQWFERRFGAVESTARICEISVHYQSESVDLFELCRIASCSRVYIICRRPTERAVSAYWYYLQTGKTVTAPHEVHLDTGLTDDFSAKSVFGSRTFFGDTPVQVIFLKYKDTVDTFTTILRNEGLEVVAEDMKQSARVKVGARNYHLGRLLALSRNWPGGQLFRDAAVKFFGKMLPEHKVSLPSWFEDMDEKFDQHFRDDDA